METVITTPGYQFFIPFLADIYKFDGTTQEYVMAGNSYRGTNVAPNLTVRAKDGSNFWFDELKIQYELIPGAATEVLRDSGLGDNYKEEWIKGPTRARSCGTSSASTAPLTPRTPRPTRPLPSRLVSA